MKGGTFDRKNLIGVGLRQPHYSYVLENKPPIGWFEVHSENFLMDGGPSLQFLDKIRQNYPLSFHGIGLSLGSAEGLDEAHLRRLKECLKRFSPFLVSEHLSWSRVGGIHFPDLLPLPYMDETLNFLVRNIDHVQAVLGQEILIENPSSYLEYNESMASEAEFLTHLCQRTGAKILLDVNNVYVSSLNHGWDAKAYLNTLPPSLIMEVHLAGHSLKTFEDGSTLLIDDHGSSVCAEVWELYHHALLRGVEAPTLIEWDTNIPSFEVLFKEAERVNEYLMERSSPYVQSLNPSKEFS